MNGFIPQRLWTLGMAAGVSGWLAGCANYRDVVDPCWPARYNHEARQSVRDTFDAQAYNGHVLDQTVWNYYFEADPKGNPTDRLAPGGVEKLMYLVRRRPYPDCKIFLQTAQDLPTDRDNPEKTVHD